MCRLHRLLAELTPGGMRRELTANKAQALLARIRDEQQTIAASLRAMRRPQYRPMTAPPVYVDRLG